MCPSRRLWCNDRQHHLLRGGTHGCSPTGGGAAGLSCGPSPTRGGAADCCTTAVYSGHSLPNRLSLPPPVDRYGFTASHSSLASPLPGNSRAALADPNWRAAMTEEYKALMDNGTWRLVPRPPRANVISGKWVFKHKYRADGSLARHKARWVVRGFS